MMSEMENASVQQTNTSIHDTKVRSKYGPSQGKGKHTHPRLASSDAQEKICDQ